MSVIIDETAGMMLGTKENPAEYGFYYYAFSNLPEGISSPPPKARSRIKLPHGWLCVDGGGGGFVPFAEDGTGWGKNDPADFDGRV